MSDTDRIGRAVAAALPERTVDRVAPRDARPGNLTARVTFADAPPVYVKTATDTAARLRREIAATRYAAVHCPVRVPAVVAADAAAAPPYLVTEPLPGTALNEPWVARREGDADPGTPTWSDLLERVGETLARVHEARLDRPGVIEGGDADGLRLRGTSWTETLAATVEFRGEDWLPDRFADLPGDLAATVRAVDPSLDAAPALLHGDLSRINLHLDPPGVLDWERALVGDPAFDLVDAAEHHVGQPDVPEDDRPRLREAIHDGYRAVAGSLPPDVERRRPLYRAVWQLLVAQAFEDWSANVDRPADDLAADVRREFHERIERARETA